MKAQFVNEKFTEKSDPIHDMNIGVLNKIKKALQGVIDLYGTGGELEKIDNEDEYGYVVEIKIADDIDGYYSIVYNYENGWTVGYEDANNPYNDEEEFETLEECVNRVEGWIEYAQEQSEDN